MRHRLALFCLTVLLLTGCISLRQQDLVSGPKEVRLLLCDDHYLLFQIGSSSVANHHKIITDQSYIESPTGKRYQLRAVPHQYDLEAKHTYVRDDLHLYDADGAELRKWANGIWSIHLTVQTDGETSVIDQQWKFWTMHYNPVVDGPPN